MDFKKSETKDNLMRAFAGESQARNRYTFAASQAKKAGMKVLEEAFLFTASQEKQHAYIFYSFLKEMAGETITVDGGYPVDIYPDMEEVLKAAQHNELEEAEDVYLKFEEKAREEGFVEIAAAFHMIAGIEKTHADRFGKFAKWAEEGKLFKAENSRAWMCLECGFIYEGKEAPKACPVCKHEQGYFVRLELAPYTC